MRQTLKRVCDVILRGNVAVIFFKNTYLTITLELDALGDDLNFEEEEVPSYLQDDVEVPTGLNTQNPDVRKIINCTIAN
jgi:hypothetical protein